MRKLLFDGFRSRKKRITEDTCLASRKIEISQEASETRQPPACDAVELLGFPVDALFDHFEAVGWGLEHDPLRAGTEIGGRGGAQGYIQHPAMNA